VNHNEFQSFKREAIKAILSAFAAGLVTGFFLGLILGSPP
jgi:hypothetical protein